MPPLSSPKRGPPQGRRRGGRSNCDIRTSGGGYRPPAIGEERRKQRLRLTPECLCKMVAIGQPSTDSIHARWKTSGASGAACHQTLNRAPREGQGECRTAHRKEPLPGPHPYNALRAADCETFGNRLCDYGTATCVSRVALKAAHRHGEPIRAPRGPAPPQGSEGMLSPANRAFTPEQASAFSSHIPTEGRRECWGQNYLPAREFDFFAINIGHFVWETSPLPAYPATGKGARTMTWANSCRSSRLPWGASGVCLRGAGHQKGGPPGASHRKRWACGGHPRD